MMKRYIITIIAIILSMIAMITHAQVVTQTESFEGTIFPAPGWKQIKVNSNVNANFSRVGTLGSINPTVGSSPSGGLNVMMLNSFSSGSQVTGDSAIMITKPFDFSNNGGINPTFKFYMYRDGGFPTNDDHIRIYINTSPTIVGSTLLTNTSGTNKLSRINTSFPAVIANTWNQYTYSLDPAVYNQKKYYFIILGVAQGGNNLYLDQFETNTYPSATLASDVSFNLFLQNGASGSQGVTNHMIVGLRCIVGGTSGCGVVGTNAVKLDSILFNTNGTTNLNDIQNAKVWYTGGSNLFSTGYISPFPVTAGSDDYPTPQFGQTIATPLTNLDFINSSSSCFHLEYDTTYFWLTYDIRPTATGGNFLDADFRGAAVGGSGSCPSTPGTSTTPNTTVFTLNGSSQIDLPYCLPTYTLGTSWNNYVNNDYIHSVVLPGSNGTLINTNFQGGMPYPSNNNTGLPTTLGCFGSCPFTAHPPDYELWQTVSLRTATLIQGQLYSITVQAGTYASGNNITAWIDYNRDGDFLDAGEQLFPVVTLGPLATATRNFTVPAVGYTGPTRMRVREVFAAATISPCAQYTWGETEDFNIFISPNCPVGFKLWLGNTNNWHDPANWCGGVPTITDSAVVNRLLVPGGTSSRKYFPPTILNNSQQANCNSLFISDQDTLFVDAPIPSTPSLKVRTNLINNGRIEVIGGFNNSITFSNGTLNLSNQTPFRATSSDARTQIIYTQSELSSSGLLSGDKITGIRFNVVNNGSGAAQFNNFTVSYALVPFDRHATNTPYGGPFTTVYGPISQVTNLGLNTLNLSTPIIWDGVSNILVQYCFNNSSNIGSTDTRILNTQTTGRKSTLISFATTPFSLSVDGCSLTPGAGVFDFFAAGEFRPNFTFLIDRTYQKPIITVQKDWINNGIFIPGTSQVLMDSTVTQSIGGSQQTNFHELQISKTVSTQSVIMNRNVNIQDSLILTLGLLQLNGNTLTILNSAQSTGTHTNFGNIGGPITRTGGFIISESPNLLPNISYVKWVVGSNLGWRVIPFGNNTSSPTAIPFSFFHTGGDLGTFGVATYSTPPNNTPFPPTVTHLRNFNNSVLPDNSANVVDRFWMTEKTGSNPTTTLIFRWADFENSVGMSSINPPRAQPWRYVAPSYEAWLRISGTAGAGGVPVGSTLGTSTPYTQSSAVILGSPDSCRLVTWNWPIIPGPPTGPIDNYIPWALSNNNQPLPIELADFNAYKVGDKVKITWVTLSETDNSHFVVERYDENLSNFKEIDVVYSYFGNSNEILSYHTWDNDPLVGLQFYRLRQVDYDGDETYSEYRSVNFGVNPSLGITNLFGGAEGGLINLEIETNNTSPIKIKIIDVNGKVLYSKENIPTSLGSNMFLIDCKISNGVYFMIVENEFDIKSRKFFK